MKEELSTRLWMEMEIKKLPLQDVRDVFGFDAFEKERKRRELETEKKKINENNLVKISDYFPRKI